MQSILILSNKKSNPFLDKILSGEKPIESRWYLKVADVITRDENNKIVCKLKPEQVIKLKQSGGAVLGEATIDKIQLLDKTKGDDLVDAMRKHKDEICITDDDIDYNSDAKYGVLFWLKNPKRYDVPEKVDHKGRNAYFEIP